MIPDATPVRFTPSGLVDAFDATAKFPGACTVLQNLIFDQVNPEFVVNIPGTITLADFAAAGFNTPTFISIQVPIGTRVYGMIATARNPGHDEPFCYESLTNTFVTISNVLVGNTPSSPSTVGDWTPPTLTVVGTMVVITHPGFNGVGANFYGIIDITNPAAPAWRSENTTTNLLPSVPTSVANYNNRAWFACGNTDYFTDILTNPLTMTNASQAIVVGDTQPITAQAGMPVQTTSTGVWATLNIWKKTQVWAVSGDFATANLTLSPLSLNIGTTMPRSVVQGPYGMYFSTSSGPYIVDQLGGVRPVTNKVGEAQPDIQVPFQNAVTPTRWAGAYSTPIYRVCGPTIINGIQSTNDYWFDEHKRRWTGPHSFAYDCAGALGDNWCLSSVLNSGLLIKGSPIPSTSFPITNLGQPINFNLQTATFPKIGDMFTKQVVESQIELGAVNGMTSYTIVAEEEIGNLLGTVTIQAGAAVALWGSAIWGAFNWTSALVQLRPRTYPVYWPAPLVFEKMQLNISSAVTSNLGVGTFFARFQKTGYMTTGNQ